MDFYTELTVSEFARTAFADDGQAAVVHLREGTWTHLDRTAGKFWQLLTEGVPIDEALTSLGATFGVPAEVLRADFEVCIKNLVKEGLLEADSKE